MSKGPGHVERAIEAIFSAEPDNAFTVEDLCNRVYDGDVERKHRVAILRAAKKVCQRAGWALWKSEKRGNTRIFHNVYSAMSHGMARLKTEYDYERKDYPGMNKTEKQLRAMLRPGGQYHKLIVEGGHWLRYQQDEAAHRENDIDLFNQGMHKRLGNG